MIKNNKGETDINTIVQLSIGILVLIVVISVVALVGDKMETSIDSGTQAAGKITFTGNGLIGETINISDETYTLALNNGAFNLVLPTVGFFAQGSNQTNSSAMSLNETFDGTNVLSLDVNLSSAGTRNLSTDRCGVNQTGLVLCMYMDETTGTLVQDFSGNGLNGTWSGNASVNYTTGKINTGLSFDGVNDYVGLPATIPQIDLTTNRTIILWSALNENAVNTLDSQTIIRLKSGLYIHHRGAVNTITFRFDNIGAYIATYPIGANNFEMHQVVATYSYDGVNSRLRLYVNGILQDSQIYNVVPTAYIENSIGKYGGVSLNGTVDEVQIYAREWSPEEVRQNYLTRAEQIRIKTNSNATYSDMWNSTSDNSISVPYGTGESISSLTFDIPSQITQDGVTIYDYNTTSEFKANATTSYANSGASALTNTFVSRVNVDSTKVTAVKNSDNSSTVTSKIVGTAGNSYTTTTDVTGGSWSAPALIGGRDGSQWTRDMNPDIVTGLSLWEDAGSLIVLTAVISIISVLLGYIFVGRSKN